MAVVPGPHTFAYAHLRPHAAGMRRADACHMSKAVMKQAGIAEKL